MFFYSAPGIHSNKLLDSIYNDEFFKLFDNNLKKPKYPKYIGTLTYGGFEVIGGEALALVRLKIGNCINKFKFISENDDIKNMLSDNNYSYLSKVIKKGEFIFPFSICEENSQNKFRIRNSVKSYDEINNILNYFKDKCRKKIIFSEKFCQNINNC